MRVAFVLRSAEVQPCFRDLSQSAFAPPAILLPTTWYIRWSMSWQPQSNNPTLLTPHTLKQVHKYILPQGTLTVRAKGKNHSVQSVHTNTLPTKTNTTTNHIDRTLLCPWYILQWWQLCLYNTFFSCFTNCLGLQLCLYTPSPLATRTASVYLSRQKHENKTLKENGFAL